jgi:hypothetical protein
VTYRILADVDDATGAVTAHFSRLPVTTITLDASAQFAVEPMLRAAELLVDARVDVLVWNGTSGSWLGAGHDEELVHRLQEATGIPATTSSLARWRPGSPSSTRPGALLSSPIGTAASRTTRRSPPSPAPSWRRWRGR